MSTGSETSNTWGKWGKVLLASVVGLGMLCTISVLIIGGLIWLLSKSGTQQTEHQKSTKAPLTVATQEVSTTQSVESPQSAESTQSTKSTQTPEPTQPTELAQPVVERPKDTQSALLVDLKGVVEIRTGDGDWLIAQVGQTLQAGQRLRTGALSSAGLVFYDGSQAQFGEQAEVEVKKLDASTTGTRTIQLMQISGESQHIVAQSSDAASSYEVNTPSGNGSAKGTVFTVMVIPKQFSRFWVDEGVVEVIHRDITVSVSAGQITTVPQWDVPSVPYYRVSGEGEVTQTGGTWVVAGQSFITGATTVVWGNPENTDWVRIEGHFLTNGSRFADQIVLLRRAVENQFTFSGAIENIGGKNWTISGRTVRVNQATLLFPGLVVGDKVRVTGRIATDGTFSALQISLLDEVQRFHITGVVESQEQLGWRVSGINLTVDSSTIVAGDIQVGDVVVVDGRIELPDQRIATSIKKAAPNENRFEFNGTVQKMDPWVVSGVSFNTAERSEIEEGIKIQDQVRVIGTVQSDGAWVADKIEKVIIEPKQRFSFISPIISIQPWQIGGVTIVVTSQTKIKGNFIPGELAQVSGWILPDGVWEVDEIKRTGWHLGWGCLKARSVVLTVNDSDVALLNGISFDRVSVPVAGEIKEASVVVYQYCLDRYTKKGKVSNVIFLYQLDALPVIIISNGGAPDMPSNCKVSKNGHIKCSKK